MKKLTLLSVPLIAAAIFAGCGGDDSSSDASSSPPTTEAPAGDAGAGSQSAGQTVAIAANPSGALAYDPTSVTAKAGTVEVDFTNDSAVPHDVVFETDGQEAGGTSVIAGSSERTEFEVEPGKYTFYCSVPGHREGGMVGEMTVK